MSDEWCLIARLDGDPGAIEKLVESVAAGLGGGRMTRDGGTIRIYSDSEALAAEAEEHVIGLLEKTTLGYELWQERWDDERSEWEELAPESTDRAAVEESAREDEEADAARGE